MKAIHEECNRKRVNEIDWNWIWLYAPSGSSLATWISQEPTQISVSPGSWAICSRKLVALCPVSFHGPQSDGAVFSIQRLSCYCMYCPVEGLEGLVLQVVVFEGWTQLDFSANGWYVYIHVYIGIFLKYMFMYIYISIFKDNRERYTYIHIYIYI